MATPSVRSTEKAAIRSFQSVMSPLPIGILVASRILTSSPRTPKNCSTARHQKIVETDFLRLGVMMCFPIVACRKQVTIERSEYA